jgi:hypothetical protein
MIIGVQCTCRLRPPGKPVIWSVGFSTGWTRYNLRKTPSSVRRIFVSIINCLLIFIFPNFHSILLDPLGSDSKYAPGSMLLKIMKMKKSSKRQVLI